jgi:hypothetical protein
MTTALTVAAAANVGRAQDSSADLAKRTQSLNNLKFFGLAMHNYASNHYGSFPPAYTTGKDGKPLLSWRVALLSLFGQDSLYKQFHLDEPWDNEHNKALISKMPKVFAAPGSKVAKDFKTNYLVPRGDDTIFPGAKSIRIGDIADGTSQTILVVEANDDRAVIWTKPDDFEIDPKQPKAGLAGLRRGGFLATFADGSAHFVKGTTKPETIRALFTRAGGEIIHNSDFE